MTRHPRKARKRRTLTHLEGLCIRNAIGGMVLTEGLRGEQTYGRLYDELKDSHIIIEAKRPAP